MQDSERIHLLLEMRKRFREARPDLNLPSDEKRNAALAEGRENLRRRREARRKLNEIEEQGKKSPGRVARMIQRYLDSK